MIFSRWKQFLRKNPPNWECIGKKRLLRVIELDYDLHAKPSSWRWGKVVFIKNGFANGDTMFSCLGLVSLYSITFCEFSFSNLICLYVLLSQVSTWICSDLQPGDLSRDYSRLAASGNFVNASVYLPKKNQQKRRCSAEWIFDFTGLYVSTCSVESVKHLKRRISTFK